MALAVVVVVAAIQHESLVKMVVGGMHESMVVRDRGVGRMLVVVLRQVASQPNPSCLQIRQENSREENGEHKSHLNDFHFEKRRKNRLLNFLFFVCFVLRQPASPKRENTWRAKKKKFHQKQKRKKTQ
jgi:hypothetical protein